MPVAYYIYARRRLVISKATGVLTAEEMVEHDARLRRDPMFQPDYLHLLDFSGTTDMQPTGMDMRRLADVSPWRSGARRAFVVPRPVLFGLARMFQIMTEGNGVDLQLFDDVAKASQWLGIKPSAGTPRGESRQAEIR